MSTSPHTATAMPNGPVGALTAYLENLKRVARRQVSDLTSSPEDFGNMQAARFDEDQRARLDDPTAALDFTPAGGLTGIIRRGGMRNLNMVHNMDATVPELMDLLKTRGSFSNPSVAISKDTVFPFSQSPTLVLNPRSPLFDPATHRANQLFNRDAYTFRGRSPKEVPAYLRQRGEDFRGTEGINLNSPGQELALYASPRFDSFAQYEKSRHGARILQQMTDADKEYSKILTEMKDEWLNKHLGTTGVLPDTYVRMMREAAKGGDQEAIFILEGARSLPSDYAELKVLGEMPLNGRNVSAVVIPEFHSGTRFDKASAALADQMGVPVGRPSQLMPEAMRPAYEHVADTLTNSVLAQARKVHAGEILPGEAYGGLSQFARRYLNNDTMDEAIINPSADNVRDFVRYHLPHSNGYVSDVASIYTAR